MNLERAKSKQKQPLPIGCVRPNVLIHLDLSQSTRLAHIPTACHAALKGICMETTINIWMFPKIGVPPKSSVFIGFSHYKPSILGYHFFGNTHIVTTVDGRNPANQLRLVVYPISYRVFYTPRGCLGLLPSTVWYRSWTFSQKKNWWS